MRSALCAFACLLLFAGGSFAQTDRGTITGTVTDPAGAVIPNTAVEVKNLQTGAVFPTAASTSGNYTVPELPFGVYEVSATAPGFKKFVRTGISVSTAQTLRIDIKLEVGNISEVVTVTADAPLLKTESGELSQVVSTNLMDYAPVVDIAMFGVRDAYAMLNMAAGSTEWQFGASPQLFPVVRTNGTPGNTESVRIDGQDATETAWSAAFNMAMPGRFGRDRDSDQQLCR